MSGDGMRLPLDVALPMDMDPTLRATLTDALRKIHVQVNTLSQRSITVEADHTAAEDLVLADASAGAVVVTLMPAPIWKDKTVHVKKIDPANQVRVISAGGTIDGTTTITLAATNASLAAMSDGINWYLV